MRRIRYQVASSLDAYLAGPNGEYDWIVEDSSIDFAALLAQFDTLLMGRKTYDDYQARGGGIDGMEIVVCSRTLRPEDHPGVTIFADHLEDRIGAMRRKEGKDIWLFGGGELFGSLLEMGLVDSVEPAIVPVLVGGGRPLLPASVTARLELTGQRTYPSGIILLEYAVLSSPSASERISAPEGISESERR